MDKRNNYFDNAKFLLIFLVVFGHIIRSYIESDPFILSVYKTIYTFHMPAFILVSGFFAKGFYKKGYLAKLFKKLLIPYFLFQFIYTIFYYFLYNKSSFTINPFDPHWSLWFLISLFCWNVLLYLFVKVWKLGPLYGLVLSFGIGILIGYIDFISNYLSLSRTFVFFPLFLLGFYLRKEHFDWVQTNKARLIGISAFILTLIGMYFIPEFSDKWLLGSKPYGELDDHSFYSPFARIAVYCLNIIMVFSFFTLVPKRQHFFTKWGTSTLYVYLLHGFIVRTFRESEVQNYFHTTESIILLLAVSLLLTIVLSTRLFTSITQPIIEVKWTKLKKLFISFKERKRKKQFLQNHY
ncbi:fucose 4-O-acetylase-like acetyltransferase [Bacillus pakistanensis]|uniref:Fucose 4-O-acetylase-like acetyltransferase n=1 Tax=Rossellomorea pakistanensis TaxID=992288 RepID=A0ABS2NG93_9BACI|nr:acyltransferase family protein [Bacillus pakistanensis]MBM7586601.1 fucose 4-O-acetylase-like acetyltransferase [Bacillus pakistanensis]